MVDGNYVDLNIWDTAGQERFHALGPMYYRDSQGALLIYDITDQRSFEKVKVWVKELRGMLKDSVTLTIIGNKTDLERDRVVDSSVAKDYATSVGATYYETSAKENLGISVVFEEITKLMIERKKLVNSGEVASPTISRRRNRNILVVEDDPTPSKKCC
uniref:Ras-related protein Rab-21 n=1 Tax=Steinernema glaseri TaxID=37863 RepID=A0A1I8AFE2_9BILA